MPFSFVENSCSFMHFDGGQWFCCQRIMYQPLGSLSHKIFEIGFISMLNVGQQLVKALHFHKLNIHSSFTAIHVTHEYKELKQTLSWI